MDRRHLLKVLLMTPVVKSLSEHIAVKKCNSKISSEKVIFAKGDLIEKNVYFQNLEVNVYNQNAIAFAELLAWGSCLFEINQYLITGPSGSGKTKLLFAIATEAVRNLAYCKFTPLYIRASTFIREYRYAVNNFQLSQMRQEYIKLRKNVFL